MRKIKFRAWYKHEKHYRSWEDILTHRYNERWFIDNTDKEYINCIFTDEAMILEQYTGLKDKNDKEIYEGDICEISHAWTVFKREVIFKNAGFGFQGTYSIFIPNKELMEIIGNIHENPELLA